ncbi:hypothetical protein ES754_05510 [Psychrobacter frigidicola]|uniref:Uncharacterized protein n=1 Tax=Psychrobacter frigidicola TaxID=45611 RepID=A0A5C7A484_9GAMM|nr:hypothetical protein [Psychrobacter frigidicola]TXD98377.1 hypothetical protein ES754_05510 [Psychrobacter frigidicola]
MTTISPTRVSMYDFLYQDIQPMVSLLADAAQLSLPQTHLAISHSLQVIVSTLLAYQQHYQGQAVSKKLFTRSAIKELRKYNSMNFVTIDAILYHRHDMADALFNDSAQIITASEYIAQQIETTSPQAQILLTSMCVIAIRELAIFADYSQLDYEEIDNWFTLQPQFLSAERFANTDSVIQPTLLTGTEISTTNSADTNIKATTLDMIPPPFDHYWYELTKFTIKNTVPIQDIQQTTSNYLKAIGRSPENMQIGSHNDMLVFSQMPTIYLPHQRWLLQLAKISDIYLSRNRLRITSEPINPPTRPSVNLRLIANKNDATPKTASETIIKKEDTYPIWKNPIILILIVVIGTLSVLATIKYQSKKSDGVVSATVAVMERDLAQERARQKVDAAKADDSNEKETLE